MIIELSQGSDLGYSKHEGQDTVPKWEFSTTPCPKYIKPRHRHGKGPAKMPKREKFSARRVVHEARILDDANRKRLRSNIKPIQ